MLRVRLNIHGRVQGVFFRINAQEKALGLGLSGWVQNTAEGGVEILARGERAPLEKLVAWCRKGPPRARVDRVDVSWEPDGEPLGGFRIRF